MPSKTLKSKLGVNRVPHCLAGQVSRPAMGLPHNWARVKSWLNFRSIIKTVSSGSPVKMKKKCPEVKILPDYSVNPGPAYWQNFPFNDLPEVPKLASMSKLCRIKLAKLSTT